jgi:hypothetical protein
MPHRVLQANTGGHSLQKSLEPRRSLPLALPFCCCRLTALALNSPSLFLRELRHARLASDRASGRVTYDKRISRSLNGEHRLP